MRKRVFLMRNRLIGDCYGVYGGFSVFAVPAGAKGQWTSSRGQLGRG
eukprot:IDg9127t1